MGQHARCVVVERVHQNGCCASSSRVVPSSVVSRMALRTLHCTRQHSSQRGANTWASQRSTRRLSSLCSAHLSLQLRGRCSTASWDLLQNKRSCFASARRAAQDWPTPICLMAVEGDTFVSPLCATRPRGPLAVLVFRLAVQK